MATIANVVNDTAGGFRVTLMLYYQTPENSSNGPAGPAN